MLSRIVSSLAVLGTALLLLAAPVAAGTQGTPDEAKAMAEKAAAFLEANGPEKAFKAFTETDQFKDRDLYVFVYDAKGAAVAHGANPALVGKNLMELRDPTGKQFVKDFVAVQDAGWVEYSWQNPVSKKVEPKRSWIIHTSGVWLGVGAYVQ
ncbi:Single Cache domain 2-containing protein [Tistlia consotensis]|uniref:Single Cache domain 2-containing protein n=1 Tax=Tistlia consotensis USBA 355 TaxID=560819 RepID=A0A1Y6CQW0_9PROT|nr:cache domain-containing protein [Tistlia consotensis]SMF71920.1 Single Cache domain 2-containing protein [Tistlia consotensis USBA 355]SNS05906.1 Single Cache domain 2-containing protein [Tistlia consotensis]